MKNLDMFFWSLITTVVLGTIGLLLVLVGSIGLFQNGKQEVFQKGYEQGQMDGLKGQWKYEVVVKPDTLCIAKPQ